MATLFVENLTVVDFSYLHAKRGMVGESWIVDLELSGELDAQGMVFDFGHIKKTVKRTVDARREHLFLRRKFQRLIGAAKCSADDRLLRTAEFPPTPLARRRRVEAAFS